MLSTLRAAVGASTCQEPQVHGRIKEDPLSPCLPHVLPAVAVMVCVTEVTFESRC